MPGLFAERDRKNSSIATIHQSEGTGGKMMPAVPALQKKGPEEELPVQGKFAVQKKDADKEELTAQGKFAIQKKGDEEEEPAQMKGGPGEEEEPLQMKGGPEEEEPAQMKGGMEEEEKPAQMAGAGGVEEELPAQGKFVVQKKENNTGLPDNLKSGVESLSGMSMDHVKVHYNSSQPAQLNALAYAQGSDIHVAAGQERHLPHEAWHVVQQMQGRVKPTMQMKQGVPVNDDKGLETEADVMGAKALQMKGEYNEPHKKKSSYSTIKPVTINAVQRVLEIDETERDESYVNGMNARRPADLNGAPISKVREILKIWVKLGATKVFATNQLAIAAAVKAQSDYTTFSTEREDYEEDGVESENEGAIEEYKTAHINDSQRIVLLQILGNRAFKDLADQKYLGPMKKMLDGADYGLKGVELMAPRGTFKKLIDLNKCDEIITNLTLKKANDIIIAIKTVDKLNGLFDNLAIGCIRDLSVAMLAHLAEKSTLQIAAINAHWTTLSNWMDTTANLDLMITITGAGYTFSQISTLANLGATPTQVRTIQQIPYTYVLLEDFAKEALKYSRPWTDIVTIATANPAANIGQLRTEIRNTSLARINKLTDFTTWIQIISNLMTDAGYTLEATDAVELPRKKAETWERVVTVKTAARADAGTFVVHTHPDAANAAPGSPYASAKHIKPVRGDKNTARMLWSGSAIPANIKAVL